MLGKATNRNLIDTLLRWLTPILLLGCIVAIAMGVVMYGVYVGLAIALIPLGIITLLLILKDPFWGFVTLFLANYFIIAAFRYSHASGLSVMIDVLILLTFLSLILNFAGRTQQYNNLRLNGLIIVSLIWYAYCILELLNPSADTQAWILSRGITSYFFVMVLLTLLTVRKFNDIKILLYLLSVCTLIAAGKGMMQQFIGFDSSEVRFLNEGGGVTHLLTSGTRYFSIFPSAGIFGAVMGFALVVYFIVGYYAKSWERIYFFFVAALALYGLMISGTRGAMAIPAGGFFLFIILSKRVKSMILPLLLFIGAYFFFTQTDIGQSNQYIRRMRTILDPKEPSLVVRKENQKLFAEYLQDKPFGEGLGLSGVDAQSLSDRYTTSIPTDSWYVKIWVETGIVGLCLHLAILGYILLYGIYLILFRIRNDALRGVLAALHCGVFGILIASYGNQLLGQFPIVLLVYMSMGLVFLGPILDKRITEHTDSEEQPILTD